MHRRREQLAAAFAFDKVEQVTDHPAGTKQEYRSLAREFPAMLSACRLPAAVAFLRAKGGGQHQHLYNHLQAWSFEHDESSGVFGDTPANLLLAIRTADNRTLRRMERSAIRIATWLKRAAEVVDKSSQTRAPKDGGDTPALTAVGGGS